MSGTGLALLRIGAFAREARVTIKTLRFYDRAGVFQPACVDPKTGYRLYSTTQLPALHRIRMLRDLGCSITEIRDLIALPEYSPAYSRQLTSLRRRLLIRVALAEQKLKQLDALITPPAQLTPDPLPTRSRHTPSILAFTLRDRVRANSADIHAMFESAERQVARYSGRAPRSPFLLLHDMEYRDDVIDVEVCVPVTSDLNRYRSVRTVGGERHSTCVRFSGSYEQAPILFSGALNQMLAQGTRLAGPIREVYLRFGADQRGYTLPRRFLTNNPACYETELQIPITRT